MFALLFISRLIFCTIALSCYVNCIILETKQGTLDGEKLLSRDGRAFYAFYKIPYAEPPVGDLRFKDPVPPKPWNGIRDATILPPVCLSHDDNEEEIYGQEDCLYLNVYTPEIVNSSKLLPVMVFIYGGAFTYGNALPDRYGAHYFMDEDVILITFHYRLGVLGFLSTEDEVIPGNYGLKDTVAVLQWIQNYIDAFSGDKNRVTVFGGSSGGMSALLTLISPLAQGLFHRVISQSGPAGIPRTGIAKQNAWKFASYVGCNDESITTSEALLSCLKNVPAKNLTKNNTKLRYFGTLLPTHLWGPVIENEKVPGAFLVDEPAKLFLRKTDIPVIMGMNSADGAMTAIFTYYNRQFSVKDELEKEYKKYFPLLFGYGRFANNSKQIDLLTESLINYYFGDKTTIHENVHAFSKMYTCMAFLNGIKNFVELYKGPIYVYYYDHRNEETFAHMYGEFQEEMGVIHGDELISMFNWSSVITPVTEGVDLAVSKKILQLWTNFAAKGDPNDDNEYLWKPVDSPHINHLCIRDGSFEMKNELLRSEIEFLENVFKRDRT